MISINVTHLEGTAVEDTAVEGTVVVGKAAALVHRVEEVHSLVLVGGAAVEVEH